MFESSYSIDLRLEHPHRDPSEVTSALNMEPDRCWSAGSARVGPSGEVLGGFNKENRWSKVVKTDFFDNMRFEKVLLQLASDLQPAGEFLKDFRKDGGVITLETLWRIGSEWPQEKLRHSLLMALGELGIDLVLSPLLANESREDA
jgi:hypothetical protein